MATDNKNITYTVGGGFCNILFFILLVLKLIGNFNFSWWIVTAPLWVPLTLFLSIGLLFVIGFLMYCVYDEYKKYKCDKRILRLKDLKR